MFFAFSCEKFYGGLMNKVFNYGTVAALAILLAFTACEQTTDSDSGSGGGGSIPSYQSDLDGIAVAFADGAPTVYLKNDLHLSNGGELVIPEGKTLDLTDRGNSRLTIDRFTKGSKIVVLGNITFASGNSKDIVMAGNDATFIARKSYVDANVNIIEDVNNYTPDPNKHIVATADQIVYVADFDIANKDAWETVITQQIADNTDSYLAVVYSSVINETIANNISKYGAGRRLYIIGDVTFGPGAIINVAGLVKWTPSAQPASVNNARNVFGDDDGSLVIAGSAKFEGDAQVSTQKGFTVLGTLSTGLNRTDTPITNLGPFVTYVAQIDGGAQFGDDVYLLSSALTSNLGASVTFGRNLIANGPVVITAITLGDASKATFNGTVEFRGTMDEVKATIDQMELFGDVVINNTINPVKLTKLVTTYNRALIYEQPFIVTYDDGTVKFTGPVTFNKEVTLAGTGGIQVDVPNSGTAGASVNFIGSVTGNTTGNIMLDAGSFAFNVPVTFKEPVVIEGGSFGANVTFEKTVTFGKLPPVFDAGATFNDVVTFGKTGLAEFRNGEGVAGNGDVVFVSDIKPYYNIGVIYRDNVTFNKDFSVTSTGVSFGSNAVFKGKATFGSEAVFLGDSTFNGNVIFSNAGSLGYAVEESNTKFNGNVTVGSVGAANTLTAWGTVTYSENGVSIVFTPNTGDEYVAPITTEPATTIYFSGGNLNVPAGTLDLGSASVVFKNGASLLLDPGAEVFLSGGTGSIEFDTYKISVGTASYSLQAYANSDAIKLNSSGIAADTNKFGSLAIHPIYSDAMELDVAKLMDIQLKDSITLNSVNLNLKSAYSGDGGSGSVITVAAPSESPADNIVITLSGGTLVTSSTGISVPIAAGINGQTQIRGGTMGTAGDAPWGFILANGPSGDMTKYANGKLVTFGGTDNSAVGGTIAKLGVTNVDTINSNTNFNVFFNSDGTFAGPSDAWAKVAELAKPLVGAVGSVAVFQTVAPLTN
jgi:hypothetical protein